MFILFYWFCFKICFCSADDKFDGTYPTNVVVRNNSLMQWVPPGMFKSTCDINIAWFPFDLQNCTVKFGSWTYPGKYIDLRIQCPDDDYCEKVGPCTEKGIMNLDDYVLNGEFDIVGNSLYLIIRKVFTHIFLLIILYFL